MKFFILILSLSLSSPSYGSIKKCSASLSPSSQTEKDVHFAQDLSQQTAEEAEKILENAGAPTRSKRGYAILIASMVGSAALTTYLGTQLPPELQFASIFIAQVSTLGVYILGAPIWEPLSSKFRKWAFGMSKDSSLGPSSSLQLESTWLRTQEHYSLNSQMSRNIISQFIFTLKENFYQAYRAYSENNPVYAADQIAEAAFRMKTLFKDVHPSDPSVAAAIQSAFTNHLEIAADFETLVWSRIETLDAEARQPEARSYYQSLLKSWLN